MNKLFVKMQCKMLCMKENINDFLKKEKGGSEIIAMVLVIAVVLVLAAMFWDKIQQFFTDLWNDLMGKNPMDDIKK